MSFQSYIINGSLNSDGTLKLDNLPPLPPGRVRVTLEKLPESDEDDLNWGDLDYREVPLRHGSPVAMRIEHRGKLKPAPHDLDE